MVDDRFSGKHDTALYAVIGDFNDTPYSPYIKPLIESNKLTDVVREHLGVNASWTYYWRSRNYVSQIDFVHASKSLAQRVRNVANANSKIKPYIERGGLAFKRSTSEFGHILPVTLVRFEADPVTPKPATHPPPNSKVAFDFDRYEGIWDDWRNNISDHYSVKVWF